jgi:hypothetical protein
MGILKNDFDIGNNGTEEKFVKKLGKTYTYASESRKNKLLIGGAVQAFLQGRPENIQAALLHRTKTAGYLPYHNTTADILFDLSEKSTNKLDDITLALAKIPEDERKAVLNKVLHDALGEIIGGEPFFSLLLEAGADANAVIDGHPGMLIVRAIDANHPISVIKLLHDSGASFDDARTTMHGKGRDSADIATLDHYQKVLTGKTPDAETDQPAPEEADTRELLRAILAELKEITRRLPPAEPAANADRPKIRSYARAAEALRL